MIQRKITFNEELHRYTDEYNIVYTSATQLIGKVEPEYNSEFWAVYRVLDQFNYKPRPYLSSNMIEISFNGQRQRFPVSAFVNGLLPVSKEVFQVKQDWEDIKDAACRWGTTKHMFLEDNLNKILNTGKYSIDAIKENTEKSGFAFKVTNLKELSESPLKYAYPLIYRQICNYINEGWTLFSEKRVYDAEYQIAGTIDLLLVKNGECFIIDWKTNRKQLKFTAGYYEKVWNAERTEKYETDKWKPTKDTMLFPLNTVPHCKGSTYILQLSLYHYLCFRWGLKPVSTLLVHIRPQVDKYGKILLDKNGDRLEHEPEFYQLPIWKKEIRLLVDWHKHQQNNS